MNSGIFGERLWYQDAVIDQLHMKSFYDTDGDGIGDFRGLTDKLDSLTHRGVTALWLLPFSPSPQRDDGYDIADDTGVHPSYGTIRDFRRLLDEAHRRGLRVITELVINLGIRRRLAPLRGDDRRKIELLTSLLLSLTGTPVPYYGDEIGMGDNIDLGERIGVRTPMQWSSDRNGGVSKADPQRLSLPPIMDPVCGDNAVNVEKQLRQPSSLPVSELDLSEFKGRVPVEILSRTAFPPISEQPYLITLPGDGVSGFVVAGEA